MLPLAEADANSCGIETFAFGNAVYEAGKRRETIITMKPCWPAALRFAFDFGDEPAKVPAGPTAVFHVGEPMLARSVCHLDQA